MTFGPEKDKRTATLIIDPTSNPKTFDIMIFFFGIYELKGDELKICLGSKRPTEFASKAGSDNILYVFKRAKKKEK